VHLVYFTIESWGTLFKKDKCYHTILPKHPANAVIYVNITLLTLLHTYIFQLLRGHPHGVLNLTYRVSIKCFPDYKHLLQENCVEYKHFFFKCNSTREVFYNILVQFSMCSFCIPRSFCVINVCNQGKNLYSSCILETVFSGRYELRPKK
jgi:hypothetical protein